MSDYRTFTSAEQANRDAWTTERMESDCADCNSDAWGGWQPAQRCPVHGEHFEQWWHELNVELDQRWPGSWHRAA